jgi:oxygen-independent coproporphyrinogen III oxidase
MRDAQPAGALYVHFPFCLSVCPYCDFVVYGGRAARSEAGRIDAFVAALLVEIELRAELARGTFGALPPLTSVYLGGGTPSLLTAHQAAGLLARIDVTFGIAREAEITIEANPGTGERGDLRGFRAAGLNRLSVGAQSMDATELRRLGRRHAPSDVIDTVQQARAAGFHNVSLDLLYDVPEQAHGAWRQTLAAALALEPDHVSAYALNLDDPDGEGLTGPLGDHLPLRRGARQWRRRARAAQDEERAAVCYEIADEVFTRAGLDWYELSNWARPGRASRHNLAYWLGRPYEAVGPGAHAFDGGRRRRWNAARLDAYIAALSPGDGSPPSLPPGAGEALDPQSALADAAILRLRLRRGLPAALAARSEFADGLGWGRTAGLLAAQPDGRLHLTMRGRLLAGELFWRLLPDSRRDAA